MLRAIDVSSAQSRIDWRAVKAAGIDAAWIKASEGRTRSTKRRAYLQEQAEAASKAGVLVGAYHFARLGSAPDEHAAYLHAVDGLDLDLPMWLDVEPSSLGGGRYAFDGGPTLSLHDIHAWVSAWLELEPSTWLYGYASMLGKLSWPCPLVIASRPWGLSRPPSDIDQLLRKEPKQTWQAWQYASKAGRVEGVTDRRGLLRPVDLVLVRQ
jgi:lysozyme